ncbi:ATP-binding cassette domain-containing protein [Aestuariicella sp. G3-2]|uniref:ATP-binding cassette domain-containing protein n=1 Tax=Pseudomaricurvus albidus TaxID=2842452 RepID=UPI001C0B41FB|nr:ATP-binding cassette domain-containing protein [Aestuariicella albida]MBU3069184.1 ATP-binding cassette domain-containing protein [Aestuariicella albida]
MNTALPPEVDIDESAESLPGVLLQQIFSDLNISVETGALKSSLHKTVAAGLLNDPLAQLRFVIKDLQLKNVAMARLRWARFDLRRLPALVVFRQKWYLVKPGNDPDHVLVTDSDLNQTMQHIDSFVGGEVIWLRRREAEPVSARLFTNNPAGDMVRKALFREKRWIFDVVLATLIVNLLAICTSIFAMQTYDRVVPTLAYATLTTLVVGMFIVVALDWLLKVIRAKILDQVSCEVDKALSQQVFDHVMHLQLDKRPRSLGTLSAQVTGLDSVRQFLSSAVIFSLVDFPFALLFIVFIYILGGPVALVYMTLFPLVIVMGWLTQKKLKRLSREQMIRSNERQGVLVDCLRGTETIRSANANWRFSEIWQSITETLNRYSLQQKTINSLSMTTTGSLSTVAYVSAIVVGVTQIEAGSLTMGGLIACSILGGRVIGPVARVAQQLAQWQQVEQALYMVNQVLNIKTERSDEQNLVFPNKAPDSISLEEVRFSYGESPIVQLNIPQLNFKAGERVALFGPIGSGKSTLLKVIAGLYRPTEGRVKIGGVDLWELDPAKLSESVSYLPQNVSLFKGTLRSNLALSGAVSDDHLVEVAAKLGVNRIAESSPQHMNMEIFEGGDGLSEGQRQLVGLARVFLARPKIWLLDEPTASLDQMTETQVIEAISEHVGEKDILLVSTHRPMIANKLANRILLVQQGKVVEDGKPNVILPRLLGGRQPVRHMNQGAPYKGPGNIDVI